MNITSQKGFTSAKPSQPKLTVLKKRLFRNILLNVISIVLILGGMIWTGHFFWRFYEYEITNDAVIDQYIAPVNVRLSGYIREVRFTEHQKVSKGDTLLLLDDREYRIKLMDAEAALLDALASDNAVGAGIRTSRNNIGVSEAKIAETKASLWKARQDFNRYTNLLAEESVSRQQYEQVKADYDASVARYDALVRQKESAESQSDEVTKKKRSAEALILRRKADLEMARLNLSYTVITAPYDGYMGRRTLEQGQLVQAGQSISNIIKAEDKWVTANYKETQIANIYVGQPVNIRVDAFHNKVIHGRVSAISEATGSKYSLIPTDNSSGNFVKIQQRIPVRIELHDADARDMARLRAGMMVVVEAKIGD